MLLSVIMNDKSTFEAIWAETQGRLVSGGVVTWTWNRDDGTSATDGDEDVAYALILADARGWGTGGAASSMVGAIWNSDVEQSVPRIKLGSSYDVGFNPSYFTPYFYRKFAEIDSNNWNGVLDNGYNTVSSCQAGNGLIADWCSFDGNAVSASSVGAQVCGEGMCGDTVYAYEAARTGLRMGIDACWGDGNKASGILNNLVSFFADEFDGGATIGQMKAGYLLTGSEHQNAVPIQAAFIGPLGIAAKSTGHDDVLENAFRTTIDILESPQFNRVYYSTSLGVMSLLEMSGNVPH